MRILEIIPFIITHLGHILESDAMIEDKISQRLHLNYETIIEIFTFLIRFLPINSQGPVSFSFLNKFQAEIHFLLNAGSSFPDDCALDGSQFERATIDELQSKLATLKTSD